MPAPGQFAQPRPRHAMVEEQTGVEVIAEIDPEFQPALGHDVEQPAVVTLAVLLAMAAAAPRAQVDVVGRHARGLDQRGQRLAAPAPDGLLRDVVGRGVFLHVEPAFGAVRRGVEINGQRVFGHVGIVDAVAAHGLAARP